MRKFKGYMTLEASLIIPMVICIFVLLIYFSYYLYGRCMLSQDTYILAFRATRADAVHHIDDMGSYVDQKSEEIVGKKYFGSSFPEITAKVRGKSIKVTGNSEVRHTAMQGYFLMQKNGWEYKAAGRAKKMEYAKHIRKLTRIKDIGKEILDYDAGVE